MNIGTPSTPSKDLNKQSKIIEKIICDLEELAKKLAELNQVESTYVIRDDCLELQKFCAKLEYLIQLNLKEKKSASLNSQSNDSREYWTFILEILKSSRSFEDAIKYVKNINEIKTNIGRARAFIRFCLQYHRLADAIQQLTMDDKILASWYKDQSVWSNESNKSRIITVLYDLTDLNFELISRNNFELDTTWPTIYLNIPNKNNLNNVNRNRTFSVCSYASINTEKEKDQSDANSILLSSTPLEMDDDLIYSNLNSKQRSDSLQQPESTLAQSIYYDTAYSNMQIDQYEKKIEDLLNQLNLKDNKINELKQSIDDSNVLSSPNDTQLISTLNDQLNDKIKQINDLNACLVKQTNLCENLSDMLKQSNLKITELNSIIEKHLLNINNLESDNNALKFELSSKSIEEDKLKKDLITQNESIESLKVMSYEQEKTIKQLRCELKAAIQERSTEVDVQQTEYQRSKITIQLKDEEIYLLNDQISKLSKCLETEREQTQLLTNELNELKLLHKSLNEKNSSHIQQLEADNIEIKKREKAELWQKADDLEYENLVKTNSMWLDDSNVSNCMNCNSQFGLLLRKHHCRVCLKIYCYYCCNNWIEYNNNKLRACKKCCTARDNRMKGFLTEDKTISTPDTSETNDENTNDHNDVDEEDDADVNFEVRAEKLASAEQSDDALSSIYDQKPKQKNTDENSPKTSHSISSSPKEINNEEETMECNDEYGLEKKREDEKLSVSSSSKFLSKIAHKFEFKYFTSTVKSSNQEVDDQDEENLVVRKKKIKKKVKSNQSICSMNQAQADDLDTFAIVSQEEIDKIKN